MVIIFPFPIRKRTKRSWGISSICHFVYFLYPRWVQLIEASYLLTVILYELERDTIDTESEGPQYRSVSIKLEKQ